MKLTTFKQVKNSLQREKSYTANKISELANTTIEAIEEIDNKKANFTEVTQESAKIIEQINKTIKNESEIQELIGETENTNGTATAGTLMAKLNKMLTDWTTTRAGKIDTISTNAANLNTRMTATRASRLDNIGTATDTGGSTTAGTLMAKLNKLLGSTENIDTVNSNIGVTGDTVGSATAGTVMAKLNQLLTDWTTTRAGYLTNLNSRLTAARAGYLDKLANFGATGDTGGSATAGTMMAKLNALLKAGTAGGLKVKSVQHGYADFKELNADTRDITINSVNTSKSILITDSGSRIATNGYMYVPFLYSSTQIRQVCGFCTAGTYNKICVQFNWAVIEFE